MNNTDILFLVKNNFIGKGYTNIIAIRKPNTIYMTLGSAFKIGDDIERKIDAMVDDLTLTLNKAKPIYLRSDIQTNTFILFMYYEE